VHRRSTAQNAFETSSRRPILALKKFSTANAMRKSGCSLESGSGGLDFAHSAHPSLRILQPKSVGGSAQRIDGERRAM
jgi:hypothetical protein